MKKIISLLSCLILVFSLTFASGCIRNVDHSYAPVSKVILFIGDGMGPNHVANAELYYDEQMHFSGFPTKSLVDTNSLSGTTDSAAAGTAMACGVRVVNGLIAMDGTGKELTSIVELAKRDRYGAGVVTSDEVTGATPAAFSAHSPSRSNESGILFSQRESEIDLVLGGGGYSRYEDTFKKHGFTYVEEFDDLNVKKRRIFASFSDVVPSNPTNDEPTLTQLTEFAINFMERNFPGGYFLMIEGAKIDKASHSNDMQTMLENMKDFNDSVKLADSMLTEDYAIIVTADHETGKLQLAQEKEQLTNGLFKSGGHTNTKVGIYFKSTLSTVPEILLQETILNTDIFALCNYLLAIKN